MSVPTAQRLAGVPAAAHRRIATKRRRRLEDAALSGIKRILASSRALHGAAAGRGSPDSDGLLAPPASLYTCGFEEYGKLLPVETLSEKGGAASVPHKERFRSHRKKFEAARKALPRECRSAETGLFDALIFDTYSSPNATVPARMTMARLGMNRNGELGVSIPLGARLLETSLAGMGRAAEEWAARGRPSGACGEETGGGRGVA